MGRIKSNQFIPAAIVVALGCAFIVSMGAMLSRGGGEDFAPEKPKELRLKRQLLTRTVVSTDPTVYRICDEPGRTICYLYVGTEITCVPLETLRCPE